MSVLGLIITFPPISEVCDGMVTLMNIDIGVDITFDIDMDIDIDFDIDIDIDNIKTYTSTVNSVQAC